MAVKNRRGNKEVEKRKNVITTSGIIQKEIELEIKSNKKIIKK